MIQKSSSERLAEAMARARRHWQEQRRVEATAAAPLPRKSPAFTIAVSRQAGANGPQIARAVAERLGWPVYDRELLELVAEEMGLRSDLLTSVDEKQKGWLQECLESFLSVPSATGSSYGRRLAEVLLSLAAHGECVIVGRGATQILPMETTLRVRLVGPQDARIETIRQRFGISREEARKWVERTDSERIRFIHDHFQKDPTQPCNCDLVLNSSRFPVTACADLIIEALHKLQAVLMKSA